MTAPAYAQVAYRAPGIRSTSKISRSAFPVLNWWIIGHSIRGCRQWALSWDPDRLGLPEHPVPVHTAAYIYRGPLALRIWEDRDPQTQDVIANRQYTSTYDRNRNHLYGRPPASPEYAAHTWMGFPPGKWEGKHPDCLYDPHQAGLASAQWHPSSDSNHAGGAFHPARQSPDRNISRVTDRLILTGLLIKSEDYVLPIIVRAGTGCGLASMSRNYRTRT